MDRQGPAQLREDVNFFGHLLQSTLPATSNNFGFWGGAGTKKGGGAKGASYEQLLPAANWLGMVRALGGLIGSPALWVPRATPFGCKYLHLHFICR
jgi:hypothetical protein